MLHNPTRPLLSAIVAMDKNRAIGYQNRLPWHLPADLKHFKTLTTNHAVLMGRKTYESIGKPLPNRTNIILTRDAKYQATGCITVTTIEKAMQEAVNSHHPTKEIFIIGGAEIYQQFFPLIQQLYLTVVQHTFEADTFFPALDNREWKEMSREEHKADELNKFDYTFLTMERINFSQ